MNKENRLKPILVASAWPYANGSLHLGHVAGLMGADFLARYFRIKGNPVMFVSGSDCHGTPIEVKAEKEKTTPKEIVEKYDLEFRNNLIDKLGFSYNLFSKTANPFHYEKVQEFFLDLLKKELIYEKTQNLPFCKHCKRFLPDRYIEGMCPKCGFNEARGDQCDECGSILDAKDLINPRCKICGEKPIWKDSKHFFLKLSHFEKPLFEWVKKSRNWRNNARNFTLTFLEGGLHDRAITRDSSWGVPIPLPGYEGKTIYVWFEAVSGYLTASQEFSQKIEQPDLWQNFWKNPEAFHYYVHGKDNIPFHTVIWPAILMGLGGLHLPDMIVSSEYLSFEGKQFSKSRNWGVWLPEFLDAQNPDALRYYLGINGPENADSDFSWREYQVKTNTELIGKFGNFINRILSFTQKNFNNLVPERSGNNNENEKIIDKCNKLIAEVGNLIEETKFHEALKKIISFAEYCNRYVDSLEPWKIIKENKEEAGNTINICIQTISALEIAISPFLPFTAEKIRKQLNVSGRTKWEFSPVEAGHQIGEVEPLFERVEV